MKSQAPILSALTAVAAVPWPEIMITAASRVASRSACRVSRPSMSASQMSRKTTSGRALLVEAQRASPLSVTTVR